MYKEVVKFENYEGEEVEKTLYFNITKAEIVMLEAKYPEGIQAHINKVIESKDKKQIMDLFEMFITMSYGKRDDDNNFVKLDDNELRAFKASEVYSELFMRLLTDGEAQEKFFVGIMPKEIREAAAKDISKMDKLTALPSNS